MSFKPFPVVPFVSGLEKDKEPFILPDDAFPTLTDCYQYLGRIERRGGNRVIDRLRVLVTAGALGNTGASPFVLANIFATLVIAGTPTVVPGSVTVNIAAPVGPAVYTDTNGDGILYLVGVASGTINYVTGALSVTHGGGGASVVTITFTYFPNLPVMGLRTRELNDINQEGLIAFDTGHAYLLNTGTSLFQNISVSTAGAVIGWTSTDVDFFWTCNYYTDNNANKLFWATNNIQNSTPAGIVLNGIQVYNGTGWALQTPQLTGAANRFLNGCLILIPYRNRMVALNTIESTAAVAVANIRYANRARWCQIGVPYTNTLGGFVANGWYDDTPGLGGYCDAPTDEHIVSCHFYQDNLIVYFERSTWQLLYTGDYSQPFVWQRINMSLGCESTFSIIPYESGIFAIGDTAIITSDGVNVSRIDQKIPEQVFEFANMTGDQRRIYGIRDYFFQFAYWNFVDKSGVKTDLYASTTFFPNRMLVLNYREGSYSTYKEVTTCFGYFQSTTDLTWAGATFSWAAASGTWNSARRQSGFPSIIAGNQQGYVFVIEDKLDSDPTRYITNITQAASAVVTSPLHNLVVGQYVVFSGVLGMTEINGLTGRVTAITDGNRFVVDIVSTAFTAYTQLGYLTVLHDFEIITKRYNPFFTEGKKARVNYFDLFLQTTAAGSFSIDTLIDESNSVPVSTNVVSSFYEYGPTVASSKLWKRNYLDVQGQFLQFRMYFSDTQIRSVNARNSDITIHAMNIWLAPSGRLQSYDVR